MPTGKTKTENAMAILKSDNQKVKELFEKFEKSKNSTSQAKIAATAIEELKVHAAIEEELFYPAVRQQIDNENMMHEADEEHHVAKLLIAELENMTGDEDHWEAKFLVLAESVRHHIKEEEREMFPAAKKTDIDFVALGEQMSALKKRLMQEGVPADAEAKMISKYGLRGDSPAVKAQETVEVPLRSRQSDAA